MTLLILHSSHRQAPNERHCISDRQGQQDQALHTNYKELKQETQNSNHSLKQFKSNPLMLS